MRKEVGDFPIQVRISANEYVQGGRTEAETISLARHLEEVVLMQFMFQMEFMLQHQLIKLLHQCLLNMH